MARRQSPAQRAASLRNLKRARAARKGTRKRPSLRKRIVRRRRTPRRVMGGSRSHTPKIGAWTRKARTIDVLTAPAQGSLLSRGLNKDGMTDIGRRYAGGFVEGGETENVITTAKGIGTGLARNWITSKSGAYRGMGRKKILSYVQAFSSEIVATARANPITDTNSWNGQRHLAYQAYDSSKHIYAPDQEQFIQSLTLQGAAYAAQKAAEMFGINDMLPKGWNL